MGLCICRSMMQDKSFHIQLIEGPPTYFQELCPTVVLGCLLKDLLQVSFIMDVSLWMNAYRIQIPFFCMYCILPEIINNVPSYYTTPISSMRAPTLYLSHNLLLSFIRWYRNEPCTIADILPML